jgi:hypothetical protein
MKNKNEKVRFAPCRDIAAAAAMSAASRISHIL